MIWLKLIALTGAFAFVQYSLNRLVKKAFMKERPVRLPGKVYLLVYVVPIGVIGRLKHDYQRTNSFEAETIAALLGVIVGYIIYLWWCSKLNEKE